VSSAPPAAPVGVRALWFDARPRPAGARPLSVGLRFSGRLSFEQWCEVGRRVGVRANASMWWLGDWLVYGERAYGARYLGALAVTGLDYQTLRNYATVARRFAVSRRREGLSFHHHAEVCSLTDEEQDRWLDRAAAAGWSRNELRRRLRAVRNPAELEPALPVRLAVAPERVERWRHAAELSDCTLAVWAAATLDEAANRLLRVGS
jgi:hypothetical protein